MKESDQALNRHQVESCDVTSRHIFWANCFCSVIKTPLQLHVDYESNNTVNKRMFPQQFEESLSVFQLLLSFFLPSNVWQEFKKLGSACCTVCRREFIWGYDSGFGSAANFWLCSPLQPRPGRNNNMCNTATDEAPILTTSSNTPQRGRAFSWSTITPDWISAKVTCVQIRDACDQKGTLAL